MPDLFRKAVDRIMAASPGTFQAVESPPGPPGSYGWLRRSELDTEEGEAWELPSGETRLLAAFTRRADPTEGLSALPLPSREA